MKTAMIFGVAMLIAGGAQAQTYGYSYGTGSNPSSHSVSGHFRSNGTYVDGYRATNPNSTTSDNYGAYGNYNPYSGQTGRHR